MSISGLCFDMGEKEWGVGLFDVYIQVTFGIGNKYVRMVSRIIFMAKSGLIGFGMKNKK